jgi:hypothetical protein
MPGPGSNPRGRGLLALAVVGVLVSAAAWGANRLFAAFSCAWDTSVCGEESGSRTDYRGRLFDYQGRPAPETELEFRNELYGTDFALPLSTDGQGRFCVRAATYGSWVEVVGQGHASRQVVRSDAPVDPRFDDPEVLASLRGDDDPGGYQGPDRLGFMTVGPGGVSASGAYTAVGLWDPASDQAASCADAGSPTWYRFDDLEESWQYRVLDGGLFVVLLMFAAAVVLLMGAGESRAERRPATWACRVVACAGGVHALLFVVLWFVT